MCKLSLFPGPMEVSDWTQMNVGLYSALQTRNPELKKVKPFTVRSKKALPFFQRKTMLPLSRIIAIQIYFKRYSRIKDHFLLVRPAEMGEINWKLALHRIPFTHY